MAIIDDILELGRKNGDSPQDVAAAIDLFHLETSDELGKAQASTEERFRALSKLDDDRDRVVVDLRNEAMGRELVKQFPDPVDRQSFLHVYSAVKPGDPEFPSQYDGQARAINSAGEQFTERKRSYGDLNFGSNNLGSFVQRPMGGNKFQFLLKTTPPADSMPFVKPAGPGPDLRNPMVDALGISRRKREEPVPEFMTREVTVDRDALIKDSEAKVAAMDKELNNFLETNGAPTGGTEGDQAIAEGFNRRSADLEKERNLLAFRKKASLDQLAKTELIGQLKDDGKFKDKIPNDWLDQFTVRPVLKVVQSFARTGAAVVGDQEMLLEPDPIDALVPGALRNRFENKSGEPVADLISSGIESLITYMAPGGVAKVGNKILPFLGNVGKAAVIGNALRTEGLAGLAGEAGTLEATGATTLSGKLGFGGFGTTSFGNSYANRLQLAENTEDPVEAARIRRWAPWLAIGDAVKEMITEKLIPGDVEDLIAKGLSGSLAKRLFNAGLVAPAKEGLEEVAGVGLEQLYLGTPGTPDSQSPVEAFKGGFFGGLAFAPAAFHGAEVKPSEVQKGKWDFNGQVFTDQKDAETAKAESLARVEDTLKPAGIITQEDAVAFLEDFDRRAAAPQTAPSQDEKDFADTVTALAPLLPNGSGPASVDQTERGAADTGGLALPEGGIAPAGVTGEIPSPAETVKEEIPAEELGISHLNRPLEEPAQIVPEAPTPVAVATPLAAPEAAVTRAADIEEFAPGIKYFAPDTSTPVGQVLTNYEKATGRKVVLYDAGPNPQNGRITDGFVIPGDRNTVYMARNTVQPFLHVLGHETSHTLENMPEYNQFVTELQRLEPEAWEKNHRTPSEFVADVIGSRFNQKDFWDRLQKEMEPSLFRKFVDFVSGIWEKLKTQLGTRNVAVNNVEAIDRMLAGLLRQPSGPATTGPVLAGVQQSINVEARGRQSGFGFGPDLDLYNIVQPGSKVDGTTFAVETGATPEQVQQRAREKFTEAGEAVPGAVQQSSVTPEQDAAYMAAVENGDMETAQQMVDEAAKAAGYNVGPVLHGTNEGFTEFEEASRPKSKEMFSFGFHFTDSAALSERYGRVQMRAHLAVKNPLNAEQVISKSNELGKWVSKMAPRTSWFPDRGNEVIYLKNALDAMPPRKLKDELQKAGYDALIYRAKFGQLEAKGITVLAEGDTTIVLNPSQIKSADPTTVDDKGQIVPLSQRFNPASSDIRFSQVPALNATDAQAIADGATGTKNAAVDALRIKYGIEGARVVTRENREDVLNAALAKMAKEPRYQDNLIDRLLRTPAPVEPVDACILMLAALDSQQESEAASVQAADLAARNEPVGDALARLGAANDRLRALLDINDATGTLAGRTLNFRRYMLQRDYTFVRMEKAFQSAANQGAALNAQQLEFVQMMNRQLNEKEKKIRELEARNIEAEVQEHMVNFFGDQARAVANVKAGLSEAEFTKRFEVSAKEQENIVGNWFKTAIKHSTVEEIDGIQFSALTPMPANVRAGLSVVGAKIIDEGVDTLEGFRAALIEKFGSDVFPYADSIFDASKALRTSLRDKHVARKGKAKPSTTGAATARRDAAANTVAAGEVTDQEPPRELVKAIVQQNVEAGLRGPREVFSAALADLLPIYPDLTEDDLKRIFSNYGKAIFPSKDEIKMQMAELQQIGRLEVTIADLQAGLPALRTGPQRQEATEQIRRLQKQVNELKRKTGVTQRTESQLKGALDAAKTRLRNEIEDLTTFIEAGGRSPEQKAGRTPTVGDAELDKLRKRRDELRTMLEEVEGPDVPTEAERVEATIKALKRTEELLTARLEAGPLAGPREAAPTVTSEEIEERRSYVTTLRELIQEEKDAVQPMAVPFMQALDRAQASLDRVLGILDGSVEAPVAAEPQAAQTRQEEDIRLQIAAARQLLADEKATATAPARALAAAQKAFDRMTGIMDGSFVPEPGKEQQALSQAEEDLRSQVQAMRQVLADEKRAATAPQRALDAAQRAVDGLSAILEGTATRSAPVPRQALSQAEEDLRSQAAAMRQLIADEARAASAPARQLKTAQESLKRLEALLAGPLVPADRTVTAPLSEEEQEVREQILTVKSELAALRANDPALSLAREKKAISNRIGTLKAKLAAGDFVKKKKPVVEGPDTKATSDTRKDLNTLQAEYVVIQKEWHRRLFEDGLKSRTLGKKTRDFIGETLKLARITELGFDFGIILRQGGRTVGRPDLFARALAAGARATISPVTVEAEWNKIKAHPRFQLWMRMGLEITDPDDIVAYKREEAFQSRWLMKEWKANPTDSPQLKAAKFAINAPLGTSRALARGQIVAIDVMRLGMAEGMAATLSRYGAPTEAEMRSYARMANASTGRGSIDAEWERGVGTLFLAYRWAKSGLEYVTLRPLWQPVFSGDATLRSSAVIAAEYGRNLSGIGLFILAWYMAHWKDDDDKWKIEWDPRSPRFGKLPFGDNTLVDPTAGLAQWVTLISKMVTGQKKSQSGKIMELAETDDGEKPAFGQGRLSELASFARYKLNPVLGAGRSITSGRDAVGEKTNAGQEAAKLFIPLVVGDVGKAVKANGFPKGYALSLMGIFGMSIQTWEEKHRENLTGTDRVWLYKNALSVPALSDTATVGDVLGDDKKAQKRKGNATVLTDEQQKALLAESLPAAELAVAQIRERQALLPDDLTPEKRAEKMKNFQNDLNSKVRKARERVLRKSLAPAQ